MAASYRTGIDCDPGLDDALAILAALGSPALDVEFITTVAGNVAVERATSNALSVLAAAGIRAVPVYSGAAEPLTHGFSPGSRLHGDLARANPGLPEPQAGVAGDASDRLREWCCAPSDRPKRLVVIGPPTNIGRLLQDDSDALRGVDDVFVMGGTVSRMPTRASDTAEFNFFTDPTAAGLLLASGNRIWLYDYDATSACQIPLAEIDGIAARIGRPLGAYVVGWLRHVWEHANRPYGREGVAIHDLCAVAGAAGVAPGRWERRRMSVDASAAGRGTLDSEPASEHDPRSVPLARDLDPAAMIDFLTGSLRRLNDDLNRRIPDPGT